MNKRYSGDWMVLADDRILEYLSEVETATPGEMVKSGFVRYSNGYISARCQKMSEKGLVNNLGRGVYAITERGEQYLRGEIDTSEDAPDRVESSTEKRPSAGDTKENV
ncbi:MarR family transcriptional regulator [Haloarcula argentinensis]|uniref:MarR family transcriptional regulator n=1 Tax=Haloarcula argentinensis TaxID=43776 RepID=A0A847UQB3_HALAR|nr:MarR family transcriptional regulator [Haloarcula argentinensis]NLV14430.1 MarR family transcriptional regulator [Haloarcula argentinensis]